MNLSIQAYREMLSQYLRPHGARVLLLGGFLLGGTVLQLVVPQVMRYVIDASIAEGPTPRLTWAVVLFFALALLQQGVATAATYYGEDVAWKATNQLRSDLIRHCMHLDISFHNARTPGELIERIDGDVSALANFFSQFAVQLLGSALFIVGVLGVLFVQDWRAGVTVTLYVVFSLWLLNVLRGKAVPHWMGAREATTELYGFLEERITGAPAIRTSGATGYVMRRFYELTRAAWKRTMRAALVATAVVNVAWITFWVGTAAVLILSAYLYQNGSLTIGAAYLMVHYTMALSIPIDMIVRQMEDVQRASASIGRIHELRAEQPKIVDGPGISLPEGPLAVHFDGVSFGYEEERQVLRELTFQIRPGVKLGLLGRTGSGKTTITRLITRLHSPSSGAVRLGDGVQMADLRQARQGDLAEHVTMLTQRVQLFHATVRENLTLFDKRIPDERILTALQELGLWGWYQSLPHGLDTKMAPGGGGLSAGEAQLIAFTRVFLKNPGVVILDEPTSRLDPATEHRIQKAVDRLLEGRTAIIIAHRLATVEKVDEIMILEGGQVREHGPREGLAADPDSQFYRLLRTGMEEVVA